MVYTRTLADMRVGNSFPFFCGFTVVEESYPAHAHDYTEIVVIAAGRAEHVIAGQSFPVCAGDVYVLKGKTVHAFEAADHLNLCNVMYDPAALLNPIEPLETMPGYHALFLVEPFYRRKHTFRSHMTLTGDALEEVTDLLKRMEFECKYGEEGNRNLCQGMLYELIVRLCRYYPGGNQGKEAEEVLRLAEVMAFMERNYLERLTVDGLAERAHLSRRHFMRVFKRAYGETPIGYLVKLRIRHACDLLRRTNMPISDVAFASGFRDSNFFTRQFRNTVGVPPRDYRKR